MSGISTKLLASLRLTRSQAECLLLAMSGSGQTLLLLTCLVLVARRFTGGFQQSLPGGLWITAVAVALAIWGGARWLKSHMPPTAAPVGNASARRWALLALLPGAAAIALASFQRALPATAIAAMLTGWLLVATGELLLALLHTVVQAPHSSLPQFASAQTPALTVRQSTQTVALLVCDDEAGDETSDEEQIEDEIGELAPADLLQQITRSRTDAGEVIEAIVRCQFAARETLQVVHIAFCPPLAVAPDLQIDLLDESDAAIKETTVAAYGVRLEIRLPRPAAEPADVLLRLHATAAVVRKAA